MAAISAIVPAAGRQAFLDRCLAAIAAAADGPDETIVAREPFGVTPAEARNAGAAESWGDLLVFVDADVEVHPDAFLRIREAFLDPDLDAVFGSYDDRPAGDGTVSQFRNLLHHHIHQSSAGPATTFWAGLGVVRRQAFLDLGGFDSSRRFLEDVEFGMRLTQAGRSIVLDPDLQGTHLKCWDLPGTIRTDFAGRAVPWVELLLAHRRLPRSLNLGWRHRVSAVASVGLAASLVGRKPLAAAGAGATLIALNAPFYTLLARRLGPGRAACGIALHALHHITAVAAVPAGVASYVRKQQAPPESRRASVAAAENRVQDRPRRAA